MKYEIDIKERAERAKAFFQDGYNCSQSVFMAYADLFDLDVELASKLEDAPWPATKEELIDYANRSGAPLEVLENLEAIEDDGDIYESIEEIWPDYPSKEDFLWDEEEY